MRDTTRRQCLVSVGAGVTALSAPSLVAAGETTETNPKLVFIFDDGYKEDYTQTFPVFQDEGVPACIATPSANVDRGPKFLTGKQVTEMTGAGWEVMSHGVKHESLGSVRVTQDISSDDTRVYVHRNALGRTPHEVEIYNDEKRTVASLTGLGQDDTGKYLTLESSVGTSFGASGTRLRFTEEVTRKVLSKSKRSLGERGFDVSSFVLPYDTHDQRTLDLAREYYEAIPNVRHGGINGGRAANPFGLIRTYFRPGFMTESELNEYLDRVVKVNGLAIFGGHSRHPRMTGERIQTAIKGAKERNIDVVTLHTALQDFGLVPTPTATTTPTQSPAGGTTTTTPTKTETPDDQGGSSFIDGIISWFANLLGSLF